MKQLKGAARSSSVFIYQNKSEGDSLLILPIFTNHKWRGFLGIGNNNKETFNAANVAILSMAEALLQNADEAMYRAKHGDNSGVVYYHSDATLFCKNYRGV